VSAPSLSGRSKSLKTELELWVPGAEVAQLRTKQRRQEKKERGPNLNAKQDQQHQAATRGARGGGAKGAPHVFPALNSSKALRASGETLVTPGFKSSASTLWKSFTSGDACGVDRQTCGSHPALSASHDAMQQEGLQTDGR
jgi:hypothetical protein